MRALLAYRPDVDARGGAASVMEQTAAALRAIGVDAHTTYEQHPATDGFDVVHPFNVWEPDTALDQLRHLKAAGVPVVWQPFYLHLDELAWAMRAIPAVLDPARPEHERPALLAALATGEIAIDGTTRWQPHEIVPGYHTTLRAMLELVDHVCACSLHEIQQLAQVTRAGSVAFDVVPHGVDTGAFAAADPGPFRERFGAEDFALCVGAIELRKNQLMLVEALRGTGLRVVLVGPCFQPGVLELIELRGGDGVLHVDRLPRELVASAYAAAAVHVLPSFAEGAALANLEAAAAGCSVVVSNRSSEFEYFGDLARYCDPLDAVSIRAAVLDAHASRDAEHERRRALTVRAASYTWEQTARATLRAYERALAAARTATRAQGALAGSRNLAVLAYADELLDDPSLLRAWGERFDGGDDATLVICTPPDAAGLLDRLGRAVADAGLDRPDGPDLLALPADPRALARAADAVYTRRPAGDGAPRVDDSGLEALRATATAAH